jgi:hypothetical protein
MGQGVLEAVISKPATSMFFLFLFATQLVEDGYDIRTISAVA